MKKRGICLICMSQAYNEGNQFEMLEYIYKMNDIVYEELLKVQK